LGFGKRQPAAASIEKDLYRLFSQVASALANDHLTDLEAGANRCAFG
jgi:hypothetical protein